MGSWRTQSYKGAISSARKEAALDFQQITES